MVNTGDIPVFTTDQPIDVYNTTAQNDPRREYVDLLSYIILRMR